MGRRGPPRQSAILKLARGNPGQHAVDVEEEPKFEAPSELDPPKGLKGVARQEWLRLIGVLVGEGVLTVADMQGFRRYCQLVADVEKYEKLVERVGIEVAHKLGYANYYQRLIQQLRQQSAHLGLSPTARPSVKKVKSTANVADVRRKRFFGKCAEKPA